MDIGPQRSHLRGPHEARSQTREPCRVEAPSQRRQDCRGRERRKNSDNVAAIIAPQELKRVSVQIEEEVVGVQTHVHRGLFLERDEKYDRDQCGGNRAGKEQPPR